MAEKSILINDQAGGEAIATRDAAEVDADTNNRVIQLMDKATRKLPLTGIGHDDFQVRLVDNTTYSYGSDLINGVMSVGDGETLVGCVKFKFDDTYQSYIRDYGGSFSIKVIPHIVMDNFSATPEIIGALPFHPFFPINPALDGMGTPQDSLYIDMSGTYWNYTSMFSWDLCGANFLNFLFRFDGDDTYNAYPDIRFYAWILSGHARRVEPDFAFNCSPKDQGFGY